MAVQVLRFTTLFDQRWIRAAAGCLGLLLVVAGLGATMRSIHNNPSWRTSVDFGLYYRAGEAVSRGDDPYDLVDEVDGVVHSYSYPPPTALMMSAIQLLPDTVARYGWSLFMTGCLALAVFVLASGFGNRLPWQYTLLILGCLMIAYTIRNELYHGQPTPLNLLGVVAGLYFFTRGRPGWAAVTIALVIAMKPIFWPLLLFFLWRRDLRALATASVTGLAVTAAGFLVLLPSSPGVISGWMENSRAYSGEDFVTSIYSGSLYSLGLRLFSDNQNSTPWISSTALLLLFSLAVAAVLLCLLWVGFGRPKLEKASRPLVMIEVVFPLLLVQTFGPLTEGSHLMLLAPILVGFVLLYRTSQTALLVAACWLLMVALYLSPLRQTNILSPSLTPDHTSGLEIIWAARMGIMLLALSVVTAFGLNRLRADNELSASSEGATFASPTAR